MQLLRKNEQKITKPCGKMQQYLSYIWKYMHYDYTDNKRNRLDSFFIFSHIFINPFWYFLVQFKIHLNMCYTRAKNRMTLNLVVVNSLMFYYLRGLTLLHQIKVWWGHPNYTEKSIVYWPILLYGNCHSTCLSYDLPLRCKQLITKS